MSQRPLVAQSFPTVSQSTEPSPASRDHASPADAVVTPDPSVGIVEILSGKTDRPQYHLTTPDALIGAQDNAFITLTGWFAPKTAAVISRQGEQYWVSQTDSGKAILVNGRPVDGRQTLCHADVVEVAGITLRFLAREMRKRPRGPAPSTTRS